MVKKTKEQITIELKTLVNSHQGEVWNDDLHDTIKEEVMQYFAALGVSAREVKLECNKDGYVSLHVDDFYKLKDAN